ncbi:PKD domain-containing protein, partial [Flavobacterium sp.]|uniref:PKD domain-containing protein n=1 Tax=Flavobacterium sp. TaxID=239 RepID=UPI003A8D9861
MKQYYPEESFSSKRDFATKLFCLALVLLFGTLTLKAQNCTVNAGVLNETICENDVLLLSGNIPSPIIGPAEWSQVSGPSVIIVSPNSPNTEVTGYTGGNTYVFRYSATCGDGIYTYQDKTVVVQPITTANAGTDIASCPNSSGSLVITGNVPENSGEIGQWQIVGNNGAGVVINFPNSPTSTITLPQNSCGTTTLRWTITGPEYAPGQFCQSSSDITVTNYGGQTPVYAGPDQTLGNCYTVSQSADLSGSFGGCNLNGQSGTWEFVSGPNTPVITSPNGNLTSVNNLIEGTYIFRWTVTGPCASGSDDVSITVPAATQDVTTLSGGNENIYFCDNTITQVTLEAQTPLYSGETVEWTQIEGDPGAVIESPNNSTTLITNISDSGDPYTFRYTLTNSVTGCIFTKDYIVHFSGPTRTIEANGGSDIHGACNETDFSIPLVTTGNGVNRYRIVSGPAASPLGPFPTSPSNVGSTLNISLTVAGTYIIQFARVPNGDLPVGCDFGFDTITIVVSGNPTPSNAGSNISLDCGVTSTQLAGVPPVVGISAWTQLSGPNQATITDNFDPETTVTGLISGTYVFQYITKGEGARCGFSTANVEVYVSSSTLSPPDAGADDTVCVDGTITLSANEPQSGEYGEWSQISGPDAITFSDINDPNAVASGFATASSAYVLRWTIGYSNPGSAGCNAPVFDDVEISTNTDNAPTTAIAGPDTCYPSGTTDIPLSANDPGILEEGTWTVSPAAGVTFDNENDPNTIAHVPANGTYIFTWSIQRIIPLCNASVDDMVITVADTPLADAGPDQEVCDDTVIMAATLSSGAQGTWTRVSGPGSYTISNVNDPNATFTFIYSGFYTFRWTVDAEVCATNFDDVDLTVNVPVGTVDAGPDQDICAGDSTVLAGSSYDSFFETGEWSLLAGAPNVPTLADSSDPNTSVTGLVAGTYTFTWTISSKDYFLCPPVTDTMVIEVSPPADAGDDATYCDVTSVQLVGNDNSTGIWTQISGPASTITQSPANSYVANATVIPGNTYVFQYETDTFNFTSGGTCPGSTDTVQVEIFSGASVDPDAGPNQQLCIDDVAGTATMAGNTPPGDVTLAEWRWIYQPAGSVATIDNPTDENTTISNLTVEGLYILEWVFESASCRSLSDIVRINMYAAPSTADAGPDDAVACQQTYQTNAVAPTVGIGTWSFANPADDPSGGDVVIDNPNNPVTTLSNVTTLGTYTLTWTVTNGPFTNPSLCEPSVDTVSITFNDDPPTQADAGADQKLCAVTQTNMAALPLTSGLGTWTQTSGPNTANIASPNDPATLIFDMVAGTYEFTWTATTVNNDGCSSQDTMQVIIYEAPSSANAGPDQQIAQFSPVIMAATAPTVGSGRWTQISGPTTVGFTLNTSPTTTVTGTIAGTYVLQWNVDNGTCDASTDQVTVEIVALADLELSKSVSPTTGNEADIVTFTIEVFNNDALGGSVDATGVAVKDIIPAGYTIVPGTVSNSGVYNLGDNSVTWSGLAIANGDIVTLTFNATINGIGPYVNTAQITASDQIDPDSTPNNNIASEDDQDDTTITVDQIDLSLQKSVTPGIISIGESVVFTIQVDNAGPDNATGVTVSDQLPDGYVYISDNGGGAYNPTTGIWTIGSITTGSSATLEITASVTVSGNYENIAEVATADQNDVDSTPGNGLIEDDLDSATVNLQQADLELVKNVSDVLVSEGDTVTFTLTLSNNGPGDATGVEVQDYLPNGYTLVPGSVSSGGLYQIANSTINWSGLSLASGGTLNLTFDAIAVAGGSHFNTAQVTASDLPDPDSTPNNDDGDQSEDDESGIDVSIIVTTPSADLSLTKSVVAGNTTPLVGTQISFELIITNDGPDNATGVQVTDLLPSGYDFVNFSSSAGLYDENTGLWNVGTVDSGTSESLIIDVIVLYTGNYENITEVTASDLPDPDSTPNNDDGNQSEDDEDNAIVTPVPLTADLSLTKTVTNAIPLVGSQITFEIVVTNSGPQDATGVEVTDLLPDGYTYNVFTASSGTYSGITGVWNIGTLASGDSETLIIAATINESGNYLNVAEVSASDQADPNSTPNNDDGDQSEDDEDNAIVTPVTPTANLSLTKTVNNATPLVGSQVIFEVVVTNSGPQDATGVEVTDLLPDGYTFISSTATAGSYNGATGLWVVGTLTTGSFETLQVTAMVNSSGNYENIAEVTASDLPDPDSTPNNAVDTEDDYASVTTTPIATAADLSLTKTVNNATPLVGSQVIFEVVMINAGPQDATGVEVTDLLPDGYTYNNFTATTGTYNSTTGLWNIGLLTTGQSVSLQITATVNASGNYENIAEVTASDLPDPDSTPNNAVDTEDDYASAITTPISAEADLSIIKTVLGSTTPLVGGQVTFSMTIRNIGPQDATGV